MTCKHLSIITDASPSVADQCAIGEDGGIPTMWFYGQCSRNTEPPCVPFARTTASNATSPPQTQPQAAIEALPRDKWPLLAKLTAKLAIPSNTGLGAVLRILKHGGADTLAEWYTKLTGKDCGCTGFQGIAPLPGPAAASPVSGG